MNKYKGLLITFEGGEGCGKTVQSQLLFDYLSKKYDTVILTREPGGTPGSELIRDLLLTGEADKWHAFTESLLYLAARSEHWYRKILPNLNAGKIVICDRFQDSSVVYQGCCKGIDVDVINSIYNYTTGKASPNRTYLISIDPEIGLKRSLMRHKNTETRFEKMDISFHQKVSQYYTKLYNENKERILLINGNQTINEIHNIIKEDVEKTIHLARTAKR
jgi:dTMP kinase